MSSCIGDSMISIAFPILVWRILTRGIAGISTTSQALHLVTFLLRYSDIVMDYPENESQVYTSTWQKFYMILAAAGVLVAMRFHKSSQGYIWPREQRLLATLKESCIYLVPSLLLAYRINYGSFSWSESWSSHTSGSDWLSLLSKYFSPEDLVNLDARGGVKIAWATSTFLAAIADIPQYIVYYRHTTQKMDRLLMTIMAMVSFSGVFYGSSSVARWHDTGFLDYITLGSAIMQIFAFWMFFIFVATKVNDHEYTSITDLEAQLEAYDEERWGGGARYSLSQVDEPREVEK
ncbi:hypothetical protein M408DRAFT_115876 [Serendipita vermifera MAFF 305830]|uniref:Uncharacterized protein n=1 Tax=Serendipita vermifera MAFF 305830 TaxID=933852 RepID=A0A0C2WTV5_SERVB|nr:hypothetical protein M408DRAFT_115876 [Serendipita vermifera MAFF 305830]